MPSGRARTFARPWTRPAAADDPLEAVLALIALGGHLEVAEADYAGAGAAYAEALDLAERIGDVASQVELHSSLAQLAVLRADWDDVQRLSDRSAELAEGAGLVLKLCLPHVLTGFLRWRAGSWNEAETSYRRAVALAEDVGWSEVAFAALYGLAVTQRDRGDYEGAAASLERGLAIAERAGLTVQAILALAGEGGGPDLGRPPRGGGGGRGASGGNLSARAFTGRRSGHPRGQGRDGYPRPSGPPVDSRSRWLGRSRTPARRGSLRAPGRAAQRRHRLARGCPGLSRSGRRLRGSGRCAPGRACARARHALGGGNPATPPRREADGRVVREDNALTGRQSAGHVLPSTSRIG